MAATDDKVKRQSIQTNKWFVIDARTVKKVLSDMDLYVHGTKVDVKVIDVKDATADVLGKRGLVWYITDEKPYVLFEGSMFSNFEPCRIVLENEGKKLWLNSAEHYFQLMKCAFVHMKNIKDEAETMESNEDEAKTMESNKVKAKTLGEYMLKTEAPTYMIKIARNLPMADDIITDWRNINIDVLETAVEYKVLDKTEMVSLVKVAKTKFGIPTSISDIEFWECNKHDDVYGIKMDLHTALHTLADNKRFDSKARNEMGRILRIHLVCEQSKMTVENRALIDKIEKHMISQFGERIAVEEDEDMEPEPPLKRNCSTRCLSSA
jgi:hypothetical protein